MQKYHFSLLKKLKNKVPTASAQLCKIINHANLSSPTNFYQQRNKHELHGNPALRSTRLKASALIRFVSNFVSASKLWAPTWVNPMYLWASSHYFCKNFFKGDIPFITNRHLGCSPFRNVIIIFSWGALKLAFSYSCCWRWFLKRLRSDLARLLKLKFKIMPKLKCLNPLMRKRYFCASI